MKDKLLEYMNSERDVRGYVEEKGWAHSAAHSADALDELVQCKCFDKDDLLDISSIEGPKSGNIIERIKQLLNKLCGE